MRINAQDQDSGQMFSGEANQLNRLDIDQFFNLFDRTKASLDRWIDRLNLAADAKALLSRIADITLRAGEFVIKVGRKILETIVGLISKFPKAAIGLIIGAAIGHLIALVPILGFLLGPIVTPLAMALGLALGLREDIRDAALKRAIREHCVSFEKLRTA